MSISELMMHDWVSENSIFNKENKDNKDNKDNKEKKEEPQEKNMFIIDESE
jgi:hypothetical protein